MADSKNIVAPILIENIYCKTYTLTQLLIKRTIEIYGFEEKKPSKWMKQVKKYMLDLHFTLHTIEYLKPQYM